MSNPVSAACADEAGMLTLFRIAVADAEGGRLRLAENANRECRWRMLCMMT